MAISTFHIELKVSNVDTPERMLAIRRALQGAGRTLHAKSVLIVGDDPPPEITLYGEDFSTGREDISVEDEAHA